MSNYMLRTDHPQFKNLKSPFHLAVKIGGNEGFYFAGVR